VEIGGKVVKLQIWDTAGQERFHTITTSFYRQAMGIMLVYDITNVKSFNNVTNWLRNIEEHAAEDVVRILIGNKADLEDKRRISKTMGEEVAHEHGLEFLETSAKTNVNVEAAFLKLGEAILEKKRMGMIDNEARMEGVQRLDGIDRGIKSLCINCS